MSKLGNTINKLRKEKGWSLNKLSLKSGIPASTIHGIEKGANPSFEKIDRIAKAFDISPIELTDAISTEETKAFTIEVQNEVNKANAMAENVKNLLEYLGFEIVENEDKYGVLNSVYLAYKNISCNLDDVGYNNLINDIYKSIRGMTFNYIIKDK